MLSCATRDRLCVIATECGPLAICVAGRCQMQKGTPAILETTDAGISAVKRLVFRPIDTAYLAPNLPAPEGSIPSVIVLGKDEAARFFLRFEARIDEKANIVEAYLLLPRAQNVDSDPTPISMHVLRVIDAWDSRTIRWSQQPRTQDTGSPATVVTVAGRPMVRLDVRELVARWPRRDPDENGLAVVASQTSATGTAIAIGEGVALEVYLK